ncbi:MAG: M28 family peptidase [Nakamurella sp.]
MTLVLLDLGNTLESNDVLLPGAADTLAELSELRTADGREVLLGLISDFTMPEKPAQIPAIQAEYYDIIDNLGIRSFFEPVAERVTLSTEVGVFKPDEAVFRRAVEKLDPAATFADTIFVTENSEHIRAARRLGIRAVHFRGPGQSTGEINNLPDLVPLVRDFNAGPADPVLVDVVTTPATSTAGEAAAAGVAASRSPGGHWVRLGDQLMVTSRAGAHRERTSDHGTSIPLNRLHLVVQNGRLFQRQHPDVPVLADKGRYLIVDLDPAQAGALNVAHDPCFAVLPAPLDSVVFQQQERPAERATKLPWIQALVDKVSGTKFRTDLEELVAFGTRHSTSTQFLAAVGQARDRLDALGYTATLHTIRVGNKTSRNLIADRPGSGPEPREVVVVAAHLDSINIDGGPAAPAPGADDNGSGSAGLLSIARIFAEHPAEADLRLILFGGEEEGLFGSQQYVAGLATADRQRIRAVLNMDMIGSLNTPPPTVLLEGGVVSQPVIDGLAAAAATYTSLVVQTSLNPFNSDHVPFIEAGIPAVLTIEGADGANDRVHSERDTMEFIDETLPVEILRMNVAYLAAILGRSAEPC